MLTGRDSQVMLHIREIPGSNLSPETGPLYRLFVVSLSPTRHVGIVPQIEPRPLSSIPFPIHYSLISLSFDAKQDYSKRSIHFQNLFYKYYWTYGDVLYIDWRKKSHSYFHTLQALGASRMCDAADVKSTIQFFPHSSQHVTGNSSHSLSDASLQIIDIRTLRDFLSIRTQDMDLTSVVFCKINFLKCILIF
jgi:hypothetical protein